MMHKSMEKIAATLSGIHELKSLNSIGRRSIPPSAKSAFLDLYMRQNERDRLMKEKIRLRKTGAQVNKKLTAINHGMAKLLKIATAGSKGSSKIVEAFSKSGNHTVLEF